MFGLVTTVWNNIASLENMRKCTVEIQNHKQDIMFLKTNRIKLLGQVWLAVSEIYHFLAMRSWPKLCNLSAPQILPILFGPKNSIKLIGFKKGALYMFGKSYLLTMAYFYLERQRKPNILFIMVEWIICTQRTDYYM